MTPSVRSEVSMPVLRAIQLPASPWLAVPVGSGICTWACCSSSQTLVDVISNGVLSLDGTTPSVAMLWLDLVLGTATLTLSLYGVAWWSRKPKVISTSLVALLVLAAVISLVFSPAADFPDWYQWSSCVSVMAAWVAAGLLFNRAETGNQSSVR